MLGCFLVLVLIGAVWLVVLALQSGLVWAQALVLAAAAVALVQAGRLAVQASGLRQRRRVCAVRRRIVATGRDPWHVLAVAEGCAARRAGQLAGLDFLVYEEHDPLSADLELWRWSSGAVHQAESLDVERLTNAAVAAGGESGSWLGVPAQITLRFGDTDPPREFWAPGNQPGTLELPWRLDQLARRRRTVAAARRKRRARAGRPRTKAQRRTD